MHGSLGSQPVTSEIGLTTLHKNGRASFASGFHYLTPRSHPFRRSRADALSLDGLSSANLASALAFAHISCSGLSACAPDIHFVVNSPLVSLTSEREEPCTLCSLGVGNTASHVALPQRSLYLNTRSDTFWLRTPIADAHGRTMILLAVVVPQGSDVEPSSAFHR